MIMDMEYRRVQIGRTLNGIDGYWSIKYEAKSPCCSCGNHRIKADSTRMYLIPIIHIMRAFIDGLRSKPFAVPRYQNWKIWLRKKKIQATKDESPKAGKSARLKFSIAQINVAVEYISKPDSPVPLILHRAVERKHI